MKKSVFTSTCCSPFAVLRFFLFSFFLLLALSSCFFLKDNWRSAFALSFIRSPPLSLSIRSLCIWFFLMYVYSNTHPRGKHTHVHPSTCVCEGVKHDMLAKSVVLFLLSFLLLFRVKCVHLHAWPPCGGRGSIHKNSFRQQAVCVCVRVYVCWWSGDRHCAF